MALKFFIILAKLFGNATLAILILLLVIIMIAIAYQLVDGIRTLKDPDEDEDDEKEFDE